MHAITILLALLATLALSSPVNKRGRRGWAATELDIVTITEWTTIDGAPTSSHVPYRVNGASVSTTSSVAPAPATSSTTAASSTTTPAPTSAAASSSAVVEPYQQPSTSSAAAAAPPASSSSAPPASSSAAAPVVSSGGSALQTLLLDSHNVHRTNHSAPALVWDDGLASTALKIAQSCVYAHNTAMDGGGYGQNIGAGISADKIDQLITNMMYNDEMMNYPGYGNDNPDMSNFEGWGHFSQIVWKGTTSVGCAVYSCGAEGSLANVGSDVPAIFTVCNYKPPGNVQGGYTNVGSPLSQPFVAAPS